MLRIDTIDLRCGWREQGDREFAWCCSQMMQRGAKLAALIGIG
jgi:hypothetical protein